MNDQTTALEAVPVSATPIVFNPVDARIAELAKNYLGLVVNGVEDKKGLEVVHTARMEIRGHRVNIEKTRKSLKAEALEYGRRVDAEAARLTTMLEPIEKHLLAEEEKIEAEKTRIKQAAELVKKAKLDDRMRQIQALNLQADPSAVEALTDEAFEKKITEARERHEVKLREDMEAADKKAKQEAEEKAAREAEAERLRLQKVELDKQAADLKRQQDEQAAAQRKLDDDRRALEAEKAEKQRLEDLAKAKAEGAAKAKRDADEKAKRDKAAADEKERKRKEAEARREARRPEAEKIRKFAEAVELVDRPQVNQESRTILDKVIRQAGESLRQIAKECEAEIV